MHLTFHFPCFLTEKVQINLQPDAQIPNGDTNLAIVPWGKTNNYCSSHCFSLSHTQVTVIPASHIISGSVFPLKNAHLQHEDLRARAQADDRHAVNFLRNVPFSSSNLVLPLLGGQLCSPFHLFHYL